MSTGIPLQRKLQKFFGRLLAVAVVLLLGNSLFLYTANLPDGIVAPMVRWHVILGYALCGLIPAFFVPHLAIHIRHKNTRAKGIGFGLLAFVIGGCVLGVWLAGVGKSRDTLWLVRAHEIAFVAAIVAYMAHRLVALVTPMLRYEFAAVTAALAIMATMWSVNHLNASKPQMAAAPTAKEAPIKAVSFGASRAQTVTGHWLGEADLKNPQYCAQCHTEIAAQWDASAHHFSSLNDPFYEKTFESMQRNRDPQAAKFCGGCHDPLVFLTGHMEEVVTKDSVNALEGIPCLGCHAIEKVRDRVGNAGYVVGKPEHYPFYDSKDPAEQEQNRRLIRSKPEKHKASFLKPMHRTSEFCLACHKANLDIAVNKYRWKRGQNDYDAWHDSVAGQKSALTFFNGKEQKSCQSCHMTEVPTHDPAAKNGMSHDHGFNTANMAVAMVKNQAEWMRKAQAMLKDCVSVDIFSAVLNADKSDARRVWPLQRADLSVASGDTMQAEVLVRNRKVGHMFPGGTADIDEAWVEFTVSQVDAPNAGAAAGERGVKAGLLMGSGLLDATGRLDNSAHKFEAILLTREGRRVDIHNVEEFYTLAYTTMLPLGPADVVRYQFTVPSLPSGAKLRLTARVNYRKFNRAYTEFVLGPDAPPLPVVIVAESKVDLSIGAERPLAEPTCDKDLAMRLNDFGIAHLRQGDTRTANWAFAKVAAALPNYPDAYINMARAYLVDGAMAPMEDVLRKADKAEPGYFRTGYFLGRLRATQSRFPEAVAAYDATLAKYPDDREVLNSKGTSLFKMAKFDDAIAVFNHVLEVDPENVTAHTYLFRCYSSMGNQEKAREFEKNYLRYRNEEREKTVTELYRRNNPDADRESNVQHVHPLHAVGQAVAAAGIDAVLAEKR